MTVLVLVIVLDCENDTITSTISLSTSATVKVGPVGQVVKNPRRLKMLLDE